MAKKRTPKKRSTKRKAKLVKETVAVSLHVCANLDLEIKVPEGCVDPDEWEAAAHEAFSKMSYDKIQKGLDIDFGLSEITSVHTEHLGEDEDDSFDW